MTAGLSGRLARLERAAGVRGVCPECRGLGRPAFQIDVFGERRPPEPRGCPRCGAISVLKRVVLEDPDPAASPSPSPPASASMAGRAAP